MAFEAFLGDTRARPPRARVVGHLVSLALHGPPLTIFVTTWLTHAMLIGSSGLPETHNNRRGTFYIPVLYYGESAGGGGSTTAANTAPGPTSKAHAGVVGRSGRAGRRGLLAPREVQRSPSKKPWMDPFQVAGALVSADPHGTLGHDSGAGDGRGGSGRGSGDLGHGSGGGAGPGGAGRGALAVTAVQPPAKEEEKKKANRGDPRAKDKAARESDAGEELDLAEIAELEVSLQSGRPVKAAYISQDTAAYYRMDDAAFPRLDAYWLPGRREYTMLFRICVSIEGTVSKVVVSKSASDEVDQVLCSAIHSWRYRPRVVEGTPQPFCHPIRITYTR